MRPPRLRRGQRQRHRAPRWRWDNRRVTSSDQPEREPETASNETVLGETTVTVRRSPRIVNFMIFGAVVGALVAVVLTYAFPANPRFSTTQVLGFLLIGCVAIGVALGSVVALILARIVARSSVTVVADRVAARAPVQEQASLQAQASVQEQPAVQEQATDAAAAPGSSASALPESGATPTHLPSGTTPPDAKPQGSPQPGSTPSSTTSENSK